MNSPIKEIIQWFSRTFTKLSRKMAEAILTSLHNDTVDIDKLVDSLWIKLGLGKAFEEHVKQAIKKSYDIGWGEKTITLLPNLQNAWDSSGMNLSAKLHGADAEMREAIVSVITQQLKLNTHCLTAARALYDGYNADKVTRRQTIPKYLAKVVEFSRRADLTRLERETLQAKVRKTRRQVERLAQGGAPNKALKSAYMELLDACEHGTEKALNRAVHNACEEKSRYIAERIARTESARAWADGFVERYGNDEDVVAYRWKLSSRHPRFDICNLYAEANLWGLGKGIYPKDKTPNLPVHPHCLCHLAPVFSSELEGKKAQNRIEGGGRQWLFQQSAYHRQQILGVQGNKAVMNQDSWTQWARCYSGEKLQSRVKDLPESLKNFMHEGKMKISEVAVRNGETEAAFIKRIREYISSPYCTKEITNKQKKHFLGKNYVSGKGYYDRNDFPSNDTIANALVDAEIKFTRKGDWIKKVKIHHAQNTAHYIDSYGNETTTHYSMVHFSDKGIHLVPAREGEK